ncbi:alpha-L-fucosidase [Paenarthrobacter sp. NPDC089714]|uniref:alpha-L-fucosidase n=1 Tax=Paenarthrobacter sp. NPDC089714 TaxID=3364377 RepID=UPI0038173E01
MKASPAQLRWQQLEFGIFIHFGINTFAGKEWSDGTVSPSLFNPVDFDAGSWVRVAKDAGARYLILTAKHHDGFCLWPSSTTDYSVAASPWRGGSGDVVRSVADACADFGLGFGVYLSPWDRNAACYGDPAAYDSFYARQLTELCTGYGPLMELWFDGAGSVGRSYDWDRIMAVVHEHQPDAMVFNMGQPTIRWVGNENGLAADPVQYVVDQTLDSQYTESSSTLTARYLPPECDVSLRRGWFWHPDDEPKSTEHLLAIHHQSVGMGANLLLNLPPDTRGLIPVEDQTRLREWKAELDRRLSGAVEAALEHHDDGSVTMRFPTPVTFNYVELVEDLGSGQRITRHSVTHDGGTHDGGEVATGLTVGNRRLHQVPVTTAIGLRVFLSGPGAVLASARVYTGALDASPPRIPEGYEAPTDAPE